MIPELFIASALGLGALYMPVVVKYYGCIHSLAEFFFIFIFYLFCFGIGLVSTTIKCNF